MVMTMKSRALVVGIVLVLLGVALYFSLEAKGNQQSQREDETQEATSKERSSPQEPKAPKTGEKKEAFAPASRSASLPKNPAPAATARAFPPSAARSRPVSMSEVEMTPGLRQGLAELSPAAYDKFDYMLGFLDRLDRCLTQEGFTISYKGDVPVYLEFETNVETKKGVGVDFYMDESGLSQEEEKNVRHCGVKAQEGFVIELSKMTDVDWSQGLDWLPTLTFPLENSDAYVFLNNDGHFPERGEEAVAPPGEEP